MRAATRSCAITSSASGLWNLAFSPDESRLYSTNGNSNDISVIDLASDRVVKSLGVGRSPWGVVAVP